MLKYFSLAILPAFIDMRILATVAVLIVLLVSLLAIFYLYSKPVKRTRRPAKRTQRATKASTPVRTVKRPAATPVKAASPYVHRFPAPGELLSFA